MHWSAFTVHSLYLSSVSSEHNGVHICWMFYEYINSIKVISTEKNPALMFSMYVDSVTFEWQNEIDPCEAEQIKRWRLDNSNMFVIGTFRVYPITADCQAKSNVSVDSGAQNWWSGPFWIKQAVIEVVVVLSKQRKQSWSPPRSTASPAD